MIIATIGNQDFALESLDDALSLLKILYRAVPVKMDYRIPDKPCYVHTPHRHSIVIDITNAPALTKEQADDRAYEPPPIPQPLNGKTG